MRGLHTGFSGFCLIVLAVLSTSSSAKAALLWTQDADSDTQQVDASVAALRVVDESGDPVSGAEAMALDGTHYLALSKSWKPLTKGQGTFTRSEFRNAAGNNARLVVRAPGYCWATQEITIDAERTYDVVLTRGKKLQLVLTDASGRAIPDDLLPMIFTPGQSVAAWYTGVQLRTDETPDDQVFSATRSTRQHGVSADTAAFQLRVPEDCDALYVLINHKGFLRAFQAGPFDQRQIESGRIELELPKPASLSITLSPDEQAPNAYTNCGVEIFIAPTIPDGGWSFPLPRTYATGKRMNFECTDLAPRFYQITAFTGNKETRGERERADFFEVRSSINLTTDLLGEVHLELQTFDQAFLREKLQGDYGLSISILNADGSPAAGKRYEAALHLTNFDRYLSITDGTVPEDGIIQLANLPDSQQGLFTLRVNGKIVMRVPLQGEDKEQSTECRLPPEIGQRAPEITMQPLDGTESFTLSSLSGQVVYLEFWASWCGPCQSPMAHCEAIMSRRRGDWDGRATIIGLSIDDGIQAIQDHVKSRSWDKVRHVWAGDGGWKSKPPLHYGVRAIPAAFLIDAKGTIVWAGSPEDDVEEKIDALLDDAR